MHAKHVHLRHIQTKYSFVDYCKTTANRRHTQTHENTKKKKTKQKKICHRRTNVHVNACNRKAHTYAAYVYSANERNGTNGKQNSAQRVQKQRTKKKWNKNEMKMECRAQEHLWLWSLPVRINDIQTWCHLVCICVAVFFCVMLSVFCLSIYFSGRQRRRRYCRHHLGWCCCCYVNGGHIHRTLLSQFQFSFDTVYAQH